MSTDDPGFGFDAVDLTALHQRRSYKWRAFPPDVLPAFVAEMDFPLAPPVRAALQESVAADDCGYAYPYGVAEAFAAFASERHAWNVDPSRVALVADVMAGVDEVLRLTTEAGDGVVVNTPAYPPFFEHITVAGRRVVEVPLLRDGTSWSLDLDGLEGAFAGGARAYLLCNPHNPTGRVLSRAELLAIAELAGRHGVTVISDEIHAPLTLAGATHTAFASLGDDAAAGAVTLASASKAFNIPGLKSAVAVAGSEQMRRTLSRMPEATGFRAGILGVAGSIAAWRDGGEWLDALLAHLDRQRRLVVELLAEHLPGAGYAPPQASYLAWVDCSGLGLDGDARDVFLERGRVALGRGSDFGAPGDGFVRITMGTSSGVLEEIVRRMALALPA